MRTIIGHHKQKQLLEKFIHGKKMHHGFLFFGPEHVGKMTIAHSFARALTEGKTVIQWHVEDRAIDSDLTVVAPVKEERKGREIYKDIGIDNIHAVRRSFVLVADKRAKVLVIDDADRMTLAAQNALLKTLEEPQENRFIILVAHRPDRLLDTIVSRCFSVSFSLVNNEDFRQFTNDEQVIDDAQGRPGYLYRLQSDEEFKELICYARDRLRMLSHMSLGDRMRLAAELSKKDEKYIAGFFCVWVYRVHAAAMRTKKFHLLKVADKIDAALGKIQDTNMNKQLVIEDLLIHIA